MGQEESPTLCHHLPPVPSSPSGVFVDTLDYSEISERNLLRPSSLCTSSLPLSNAKVFYEEVLQKSKLHPILEKALGANQQMPSMEVRFHHLSLSAQVPVDQTGAVELPTLWYECKQLVNCKKSSTAELPILRNLSGVLKPATTTLVLGQPGSGKSALMKVLSGRFPMGKNISIEGEMLYNGIPQQEIASKLPRYVGYVNQHDFHHPTLTVKQNLQFAHTCCAGRDGPDWLAGALQQGTSEQNEKALAASRALHEFYPEIVLKTFGLENCANTIVGDAMTRGISGGERKRVTAAEMAFGMRAVSFMDEISTGLDSAATFDICESLKKYAQDFQQTVVISLLQPPPEVFMLFDDVIIMNSGYIIYNGPRDIVLEYFLNLGYKCPLGKDIADFLLDLGTDRQVQYQCVPPRHGGKTPSTAAEFAECFEKSIIYEATLRELSKKPKAFVLSENRVNLTKRSEFQQGFVESTAALLKRSAILTMNNTSFLIGRAFMIILMGILYSVTFYDSDTSKPQLMIGLMFSTVMFLSLGQASMLATFMQDRDIFYKQRGANFFRTSSYVISASVTQMPFAFIESLMLGSMVYWMAGFAAEIDSFIVFQIVLILTNLAMGAWFFFLSSVAPSHMIGEPLSMVSILFFVIFGGFVITKDNLPSYFIWIYWMNPVAWSIRSLAVNQFTSTEYDTCIYKGQIYCTSGTSGEFFLKMFSIPAENHWIFSGMIFTLIMYLVFMFLSYIVLEYHRYESPENVSVPADDNEEGNVLASPRESSRQYILHIEQEHEQKVPPVSLAFKDLWYTVPSQKKEDGSGDEGINLLKGISGFALPGKMTALMGSSGAGKTTLMDVIAGRKTGGKIRGQILLNGYEANELAIRRCTGYCEQMDNHSESATIREAIAFSAFLRQSADVSDELKSDTVNEVLDILELKNVQDQIIRGSSKELLKRLTIGVELAAHPSVLFLDEPTSGLDARSAQIIMTGVRKIADSGRTIVCTIHQPSLEVFNVFDSLLLLKKGGQTVYFGEIGENSEYLIKYFEDIPGTPRIEPGYNPATWMLEVIGAGVGKEQKSTVDFACLFEESQVRDTLDRDIYQPGLAFPSESLRELEFDQKRASTNYTQFSFLLDRFIKMYWRSADYNITRFAMNIVTALLLGCIFVGSKYDTFTGIQSGVGLIFLATVFSGLIAFESVLPIAVEDRTAFYRERACQTYNALWYFVGSSLVEIPYVILSTLVFVGIFYPFVGFTGVYECFLFWLVFAVFILMQVYFGLFMAYLLPSVEVAALLGVLINSIFILFMGFNPAVESIPAGLKWIYHITPQSYLLSGLGSVVFGANSVTGKKTFRGIIPHGYSKDTTIAEYVFDVFKMDIDKVWENIFVMIGFIIAFRVLGLIALRYVNHQQR